MQGHVMYPKFWTNDECFELKLKIQVNGQHGCPWEAPSNMFSSRVHRSSINRSLQVTNSYGSKGS